MKKSLPNLGSANIVVRNRASVGIRETRYHIQMDHSHAGRAALTSAVIWVFYQNFYHFLWRKQLIPQWSDYLVLNGSFFPPHCTSRICLQPKTHVLLIEFKVEKEPARVWITSGKKRRSLQSEASSATPTSRSPKSLTPSKISSRVSPAPDSAKFSPS